jgi:hypothetical protein
MDRKRLDEIARDPRMIVGVHNYCDRWCEKCPLSSRCTVFAMEQDADADGGKESRDATNQAFWDHLHDIFAMTKQMITEWAEKNGVDLSVPLPEDVVSLCEMADKQTQEHPLITAAEDYRKKTQQWFASMEETFEQKQWEAENEALMDLPGRDPESAIWQLSDAVEIVRWYYMFVQAKLQRAMHQVIERELTGEDDETGDADGSAKIALIAMDRSLAAWAVMRNHLPDHESPILDFLVRLDRLRRQTETLFPHARAFKRPGFDDVNDC